MTTDLSESLASFKAKLLENNATGGDDRPCDGGAACECAAKAMTAADEAARAEELDRMCETDA